MNTDNFLKSATRQFSYYKELGDKTFEQLDDTNIQWCFNESSNSIALIVKHLAGNMLSRWTNFMTEDGEKEWRKRDTEFIDGYQSKSELIQAWSEGWLCLFEALESIHEKDLEKIIYIRNEGHSVLEAINRQLCHYSYHVGQIVFQAKMIKNTQWKNLSIPVNHSSKYNRSKFLEDKKPRHFSEDI